MMEETESYNIIPRWNAISDDSCPKCFGSGSVYTGIKRDKYKTCDVCHGSKIVDPAIRTAYKALDF